MQAGFRRMLWWFPDVRRASARFIAAPAVAETIALLN
jgi:hypothetical protein